LEKGADNGGVAGGLLGHAGTERTEELRHGFTRLLGHLDGGFQLAALHFPERQKDVLFAGKIIEKGAFTDVSSFGDVFDGGLDESLLGEKLEGGTEKPLAKLGAAALPAISGAREL